METYIITDFEKIQDMTYKVNQFADDMGSTLPFHRLQMPLLWWKHFSSGDDTDFGLKRGRNFFGSKSWLKQLSFIIVEEESSICGVAPLFRSKVILRGSRDPIELLSFCPDSGLIFYQDMLVHPEYKKDIFKTVFQCLEKLVETENLLLFLGHVPEISENMEYYKNEIGIRIKRGWKGGQTRNCWRGGVYPWNINKLYDGLQKLLKNYPHGNIDMKQKIELLADELRRQTSALMIFAGTRKKLEEKVLEIIHECNDHPNLDKELHEILQIFDNKPIVYPFLTLPKDSLEFYSSLSSSKRYFYRRYMKKFLASGGEFETISPDKIKQSDVNEYLSLHAVRWGEESAALTGETRSFHEELSFQMAKAGYFRLFFAKLNGERIAALSCFDINDRREFYYSGRSLNESPLRAGKLLVLYSILDAIESSFSIYDFGYGGDDYKFDFTSEYKTLYSFFLTKDKALPDLHKLFPMYEEIVL